MKTHFLNILLICSFFITIFLSQVSCNEKKSQSIKIKQDTAAIIIKPVKDSEIQRESITFILGDDRETNNPYYAEATNYYLHNEQGKTNHLVTDCKSLLETRNYLINNPPMNHQPWGLINLVSHGDQWLGLSALVTPDSKRATPERIQQYLDSGIFTTLPENIIDKQSEIAIHACGVGNNKDLVEAIAKIFNGQSGTPLVRATRLFEYYASSGVKGRIKESQRYLANVWMTTYKMGYKPDKSIICKRLHDKYPNEKINWKDALNRTKPRWNGDIYHYTFEVPVHWVIKCSENDSLPDLSTENKKLTWIKGQKEITQSLKKIDITAEKFNWWLRNVYVDNANGTKSPAIWVKGYCTILCVIKPLLDESEKSTSLQKPFTPSLEDSTYYFGVGGN